VSSTLLLFPSQCFKSYCFVLVSQGLVAIKNLNSKLLDNFGGLFRQPAMLSTSQVGRSALDRFVFKSETMLVASKNVPCTIVCWKPNDDMFGCSRPVLKDFLKVDCLHHFSMRLCAIGPVAFLSC
jgi:hypothetical protein